MIMSITRGLVDRVARKAPKEVDADPGKRRSKLAHFSVPYQCCSATVPQLVYVHPMSAAYDRDEASVRASVCAWEIGATGFN